MELSDHTTTLLDRLEQLARKRFACRDDIGTLIELAYRHEAVETLDNLSFYAKFSSRTLNIMNRIGKEAEGFDRLSKEFGEGMEKAKALLQSLLAHGADEDRQRFHETYFALSPTSLDRLLVLFRELSWYKNYRIDLRSR
jgi:hypothetical protein